MAYSEEDLTWMLVKIASINNQLADGDFIKRLSGDALSYIGVKLAALKGSIVELKTDAMRDMLSKEVDKDMEKAKAYAKFKKTDGATAASDMKNMDPDYIKARQAFHEAKTRYEQLKSICTDAHDLIESVRSRVIDLQGQRKDEKLS